MAPLIPTIRYNCESCPFATTFMALDAHAHDCAIWKLPLRAIPSDVRARTIARILLSPDLYDDVAQQCDHALVFLDPSRSRSESQNHTLLTSAKKSQNAPTYVRLVCLSLIDEMRARHLAMDT